MEDFTCDYCGSENPEEEHEEWCEGIVYGAAQALREAHAETEKKAGS